MTDSWRPPGPGALDDTPWPTTLRAHAVDRAADDDRLHGYAALGDLARHYSFSDTIYLALVGDLPDERASRLFQVACHACCTISVAEAPAHIAVLARLSGAQLGAAVSAGLVAAADRADQLVASHAGLLAWLDAPTEALAAEFVDETARPWTSTLLAAIGTDTTSVRPEMSRVAATLALFHSAGLRSAEAIAAAMIAAASSSIAAESLATGPADLGKYPVKMPEFRYVEDRRK